MKGMKHRQITREEIEFYKSCPFCKREIKGKTKSQVEYNLEIHINAKHVKKEK
jgi:hypothetical protein